MMMQLTPPTNYSIAYNRSPYSALQREGMQVDHRLQKLVNQVGAQSPKYKDQLISALTRLKDHPPSDVFTARYLSREEAPHHTDGRVESEFIHLIHNPTMRFLALAAYLPRDQQDLVPKSLKFMYNGEKDIRGTEDYARLVLQALHSIIECIEDPEKLARLIQLHENIEAKN